MAEQKYPSAIAYYNNLISTCGQDHEVVGWGSVSSQERRFDVLFESGDMHGKSILDVGCGLGGLYGYLIKNGSKCAYHGVDINPHMIAMAKQKFSEAHFEVMDILTIQSPRPQYDFVFLSGVFNLCQDCMKTFMEDMIGQMYLLANQVVAFNAMSTKADFYKSGQYYTSPSALFEFCLSLSRRVVLRHDYMTHDFTIYIYKEDGEH